MNSFERQLEDSGCEIVQYLEEGQGFGKDSEFYYLWFQDRVYVGIKKSFDRWANSRDFVLYKTPEKVDLSKLKKACRQAIEKGHSDTDWALEFDIGGYYRKTLRGR